MPNAEGKEKDSARHKKTAECVKNKRQLLIRVRFQKTHIKKATLQLSLLPPQTKSYFCILRPIPQVIRSASSLNNHLLWCRGRLDLIILDRCLSSWDRCSRSSSSWVDILVVDDLWLLSRCRLPLRRSSPLGIRPWTLIAKHTPALTSTLAGSTKSLWKILCWNLCEKLLLVTTTQDVDLLNGDRIQPTFHDAPDGGKSPWCIDHVEFSESLWIVVLRHVGSQFDV